jgi:hypothetical protein
VNGNCDYSGAVNFDDYVLIDITLDTQSGTLARAIGYIDGTDRTTASMSAGLNELIQHWHGFGQPFASAILAAVPEPASVAPLGLAALTACRRNRRRA